MGEVPKGFTVRDLSNNQTSPGQWGQCKWGREGTIRGNYKLGEEPTHNNRSGKVRSGEGQLGAGVVGVGSGAQLEPTTHVPVRGGNNQLWGFERGE